MDAPTLQQHTLTISSQISPSDTFHYANVTTSCEEKCSTEQTALVECVKAMQRKVSSTATADSASTSASENNLCLRTAVANWTECCSKANSRV